jgi:hypothetical protein
MTPARQTMDYLNTLTEIAGVNRSAAKVLRQHGLAVVDADLVVIDEKRFAAWLDIRQRRLLTPPA